MDDSSPASSPGDTDLETGMRQTRYQAFIVRGDHVLLIKHKVHASGKEYWLLPGGGREPGETEEACVARESLEETNLSVRVEFLLLDEPITSDHGYSRRRTYLCTPVSGEAAPGYEPEVEAAERYAISDVAWFDLRTMDGWDPLLIEDPYTYPQLRRARRRLGYGE